MTPLKILLYFSLPFKPGGHFKSSLAIARELTAAGHRVSAISPGGEPAMIDEFVSAGITYYSSPARGPLSNVRALLKTVSITAQQHFDIIHAQEPNAILWSYLAALLTGRGFVMTKAGGPVNDRFPPRGVQSIFFSQELLDGMTALYNLDRDNITVIRARVNMNMYRPADVHKSFIQKYGLPVSGKKIIMAIRLEKSKAPWINSLLQYADGISNTVADIHIIIAGAGPLLHDLKKYADDIRHKNQGRPILHLPGPIVLENEINQLFNYGDVVVGNGRSLLEAMACRKPVIVLGESGESALIDMNNVDDIARYNFSGRHFRHIHGQAHDLPATLHTLFRHEDLLEKASRFSFDYIKKHMDAALGARQQAGVYIRAVARKGSLSDLLSWIMKVKAFYIRAKLGL